MAGGNRVSLSKGSSGEVADSAKLTEKLVESMVRAYPAEVTPEERELVDVVDKAIRPSKMSTIAIVLGLVILGAGLGGYFWVNGDKGQYGDLGELSEMGGHTGLREKWYFFWEGKLAHEYRDRAEASYDREEKKDKMTLNRYGDITLFYSPRDSRVKVTKVMYTETADEFVERYIRGGADKRKDPTREELTSIGAKTAELKEDQYFQNLPVKFLPVVERNDVKQMQMMMTYEYELEVTHVNASGKQDYKPRKYLLHSPFSYHPPPEGWTPLRFQDQGGGMFRAPFHGADLVPEPSIFMCTYAEVSFNARCDFEWQSRPAVEGEPDRPKLSDAELPSFKEGLVMQFSGLPPDEWMARVEELKNYKEDPEAWAHAQEMAGWTEQMIPTALPGCVCSIEVEEPSKDDPKKMVKVPKQLKIDQCPLFKLQEKNLMPDGVTPVLPDQNKAYCKDYKPPV